MSGAHNTEPQANGALARALIRRSPAWNDETVHAERTQVLEEAGRQPDILISPPGHQPVIVETEFDPARTVTEDAAARLGQRLRSTGEEIEGVLAVALPEHLKTGDLERIGEATFRYAMHFLDSAGESTRWAADQGWLSGGIDDLADAIEYVSLSERRLAQGTEALEDVVRNTAGLLKNSAGTVPLTQIAEGLHQEAGEQTERMAAAICVSAFVFHAAIEEQENIPPVPLQGAINKGKLLETWSAILNVNYWPIFSIARDIVKQLPVSAVPPVMNRIAKSLSDLALMGATTYHDVTGRMFQSLIADRKFLATFYTLPPSACLLAELGVGRLGVDWSDREAVEQLRIADFACGTGALLSAAQRAAYRRFRRAGGDDGELHRAMMEQVLIGLDIMPAATHLTCSMLSSAHPAVGYEASRIHTMPYGGEGGVHIGSLDLLNSDSFTSLFAEVERMGGTEQASVSEKTIRLADESCDLVIMNPPFTRPTNHEASHSDIPVPSFAGFSTPAAEQQAMADKLKRSRGIFGHGNAGLASNFMDLAHYKLKTGGVLAMVLPFSFVRGQSWKKARAALKRYYCDIHVTSIAAAGVKERSFSADTGMAECLVVATRKYRGYEGAVFSSLDARPSSLLEAAATANSSVLHAVKGEILNAGLAGARNASVIKAAQGLEGGMLQLPQVSQAIPLPIVKLGAIAERGRVHRDINGGPTGSDKQGPPRGPFEVRAIGQDEVPTYPMLWAHEAGRERTFVVEVDSCGDPRQGCKGRANDLWQEAASHLHANTDFQLNSQSLAMCLTPTKSLGGTAWPNVLPKTKESEIPLLLWGNSTLGLLLHWWKGTRQQVGRSRMTISAIPDLRVLDTRTLTKQQRDNCQSLFDEIKDREFLPANEAYRDETRKALDQKLLFDVLQLDWDLKDKVDLLRNQWCAEPSVHGGKSTRYQA